RGWGASPRHGVRPYSDGRAQPRRLPRGGPRRAVKVLHLTAGNLFGGVETDLLTLARVRHLCREMEPHFGVCFPGRLRDELAAAGVPIHDLGAVSVGRPWTVLRGRGRLRQLMREQSFAVAVTHGTWPHAMFAPVVRRAG